MSDDQRPPFAPEPVTLTGRHVRLEPLERRHAAGLLAIGRDPQVWQFLSRAPLRNLADAEAWIAEACAPADSGEQVPFATIDLASGQVAGSTRFFEIRRSHRNLEIGHTWLGRIFWRTAVNTEAKLLMLEHAFETLGALRVQFKTDQRNERSQAAIERLGAVREGVLRRHMLVPGHVRDTVLYSIVAEEWPAVRGRLRARLDPGGV